MIYKDGSFYLGEWVKGQREGLGHETFSKEDPKESDDGFWKADLRNGNQTRTWKDGSSLFGFYKNGILDGIGIFKYPPGKPIIDVSHTFLKQGEKIVLSGNITYRDGSFYSGILNSNYDPHGFGRQKDSTFKGNFKNSLPDGEGILDVKDGRKFDGEFFKSFSNGIGTIRYPRDDLKDTFEGPWVDYLPHGKGILTNKDGAVYDGNLSEDKKQGIGTLKFPENDPRLQLSGDWAEDDILQGKLEWKNGQFYEGQFLNGNFHGIGVFSFAPDDARQTFHSTWSFNKPGETCQSHFRLSCGKLFFSSHPFQ